MKREKVFVVTLVTSGKTDFGINFMADIFTNMIVALNRHRKSYEAYASEVTDDDKDRIVGIVNHRLISRMKFDVSEKPERKL